MQQKQEDMIEENFKSREKKMKKLFFNDRRFFKKIKAIPFYTVQCQEK